MDKYEMIEAIVNTYDADSVTKQNARNYLAGLSDAEIQKNYDDRITYALSPAEQMKAKATRAREVLKIYKHSGLKNNDSNNEALLNAYFPGTLLTFENFRSLAESNPEIKSRFHWSAGEPFAEVKAIEQEHLHHVNENEFNFREACKSLAISGQMNVAPNLANWSLLRPHLGEEFPSLVKLLNVMTSGTVTGFSPNSPATVAAWSNEASTKERENLCHIIADASIPPGPARDEFYRKMFNSIYTTAESLRAKAEDIQSRKKFARMSPAEIKAYLARERAGQPQPKPRVLPPEITKKEILAASAEQLKNWASFWGNDLLNQRLAGQN
jgi:hypothetical protein